MRIRIKPVMIVSLLLFVTLPSPRSIYAAPLYFPHVVTSIPWQTEIAVINTSPDQLASGILRAFGNDGRPVGAKNVALPGRGRIQINVAERFKNHTEIGYLIFETDADTVQGYVKFYHQGVCRTAIPAAKETSMSNIYIPHIASDTRWRTRLCLLNTTASEKEPIVSFNNGFMKPVKLAAKEQKTFDIATLFGDRPQTNIQSAVIPYHPMFAEGIIALELFSSIDGRQQDGILLPGQTATSLCFPHVADDGWWTGIAAYNPSTSDASTTITPYTFIPELSEVRTLSTQSLAIKGRSKSMRTVSRGYFGSWFKMESSTPLSGLQLFGTSDNGQLAAYGGGSGPGAKTGIFPKIEKDGWTGIALVNTGDRNASVTLSAYDDRGTEVASRVMPLIGHANITHDAEALFSQDIGRATYIAYASDRNIVGFQLNGSADGTMLDGLPALAGIDPPEAGLLISDKKRNTSPQVPPEDATALIEGNTSFALDLYRFLVNEKQDRNRFFSPYSISLAFAMAYGGARGNTERQMKNVFHYALGQDRLHTAFNGLSLDLASRERDYDADGVKDFQLNIANAMWGQEDYTFLTSYLDLLAEHYGAGIRLLDLQHDPEGSAQAINDWIDEATRGLIREGVSKDDFNAYSLFVLVNAIYFKAKWMEEFSESLTCDDAFFAPQGSVTVPMMNQWAYVNYGEGEDYQAAEILYKGDSSGMLVLLPREGKFGEFEASLTRERLSTIIEGLERREVVLKLPKFNYTPETINLVDVLPQMGMTDAFKFGVGDFSGMDGVPKWIYLHFARHKAFVSVDEKGTEAAAVTVIGGGAGGYPETPETEFIVNRPFIFLIRDRVTGTILFMGRILDPLLSDE